MIEVPLVPMFKITNFGKGEYKKWYYTIRGRSVATNAIEYLHCSYHVTTDKVYEYLIITTTHYI